MYINIFIIKMDNDDENIYFIINDEEESSNIITNINNNENIKTDDFFTQMVDYNENFIVKELLLICEYYGFAKELKTKKYNKGEIIQFLILFESDKENENIVLKRKKMWFYMNELKNDKFMKKYIIT